MPFTLPQLPYEPSALEPFIDTITMHIHHSKHHQAYVDNLNKALAGTAYETKTLDELMPIVGTISTAVRNNGGGHWNHSFFWQTLMPPTPPADHNTNPLTVTNTNIPTGQLMVAINSTFGSYDVFKEKMVAAGMGRFGSGWSWLLMKNGKLEIASTPNQDNPLMDVAEIKGTPLLGIDVWEHAYYLKYQNRRAEYLTTIWNVINWNKVSDRFIAANK